jgi:hypothetical protein
MLLSSLNDYPLFSIEDCVPRESEVGRKHKTRLRKAMTTLKLSLRLKISGKLPPNNVTLI